MNRRFKPFEDSEFTRTNNKRRLIPLSKKETRIMTLGLLGIKPDDCILDIGSGTGGLSLEAARIAYNGIIFSIDKNQEACKLLKNNAQNLGLFNLDIIEGKAPKILKKLDDNEFNHIIIGGSSGKLKKMVNWSFNHLVPGGNIIGNFFSLENTLKFIKALNEIFNNYELTVLNISKGKNVKDLTLTISSDPVYIVKAEKRG